MATLQPRWTLALLGAVLPFAACTDDDKGNPAVDAAVDVTGPAVGMKPETVAMSAQTTVESSAITNTLAAILAEVASNDHVAPVLGFKTVPQGPTRDLAPGVLENAGSECGLGG